MVPDQAFHLSTEPPGPIAAVWTPAVIQDCCPEQMSIKLHLIIALKTPFQQTTIKASLHLLVI